MTIKDLAKLLNLSTSTISRALSDHPDISEATKKRVKSAAEEFNYITNIHARSFRKQQSRLLALVLPEVNMFFSPNLIKGINKTIAASNYTLITFLSNDSYEREKEIIKQCLSWAVEGVLISISKKTYDLNHLKPLAQAKVKCILLDKVLKSDVHSSVTIDNIQASYNAIAHLIKKGHQNILGIFGNPNFSISNERIKGYEEAMIKHNLPILKENIISVEKATDLDIILPPILNHNKNITAIFTMSDELLAKSLYQVNKLGLSIPNDISVISISDGIFPYLSNPQITHIKDSGGKMGKSAAKFLIELIAGTNKNSNLIIPTKLVELASVLDKK
ncbi:MAG: LacI family DNA-binding transcriptional regulator [Saprospiraceae bacterium]